ncbi:hypothetical protein [Dokdonella sp.]|uniref:hypothetical protein n=1 Tax=Dokdonella sp. TaxID=2291710 RepID=UPI002F4059A9
MDALLAGPELQQRAAISDSVGRWFSSGDFASIESVADAARERRLRTSSGLWVIGLVFNGIDDVANSRKAKDDAAWDALEATAQRWIDRYPKSPTGKIALASILHNRAWFYRGGGYASTVSPAKFEAFYKQIAKAKRYLVQIRSEAAVDPNWYMEMLAIQRVERGGQPDEFERMFARAIAAFPDYYPIYFEAVTYYLPRWHGDLFEIERYARTVMRGRDERAGKMLYARIYWYVAQSDLKTDLFRRSAVSWPDMRDGFEEILAEFPDAWNYNSYARFACLQRDRATLRALFGRPRGFDVVEAAWDGPDQLARCREQASNDAR